MTQPSSTPSPQRLLVTAALPYANGPLHLGHLIEYVLADIYVRAQRALGIDALLVCANDAHGTPIEINAGRLGVTPEALVQRFHGEQGDGFARFDVAFDVFDSTHSDENQAIVLQAYEQLFKQQALVRREVEGSFCPKDQRFLPDRFIRGNCPRCQAPDQYGDVCERCGATYTPVELGEARCALCGQPPERRMSEHIFFKLSEAKCTEFLTQWIDSGTLQDDVANYVRGWLTSGLRDWCISRDGPYFGFRIPEMDNKYFYVWLDAPFGYVAASHVWGKRHGVSLDDLWRSKDTRIEHIIGKDIMYFHTLFWPAVLQELGYTLPSRVHVHGMLTVDGEKMSKSRGTFIRATTFAEHIDPQLLRYYNATKYTPESRDIDLSPSDFVARVNGELINKHINLFSRLGRFVHAKLDGKLDAGPLHPDADQETFAKHPHLVQLVHDARALGADIERCYAARDIARVTRLVAQMADTANLTMQNEAPWASLVADPSHAKAVCAAVGAVAEALMVYLAPIVPRLAAQAAEIFAIPLAPMASFRIGHTPARALGPFERLLERVELSAFETVIAAEKAAAAEGAVA